MYPIPESSLQEYFQTFVQPGPRYGIKIPGKNWRSVDGSITKDLVVSHLDGRISVATLGRWYPEFGLLDFDDWQLREVEHVRSQLGFTVSNSMLLTSERKDHYHLMFRPEYHGKPPTLRLFMDCLLPFEEKVGIEIYPKDSHCIRLPFGYAQRCIDEGRECLDWCGLLYWFKKLDPFDIGRVQGFLKNSGNQFIDRLKNRNRGMRKEGAAYQYGKEFLATGLVTPSSRHKSQFYILYYLWCSGNSLHRAVATVQSWIRDKHNGCSSEASTQNWRSIDREIERQAKSIWGKYGHPKEQRNKPYIATEGWTTKQDPLKILLACQGDMRLARFLYHIVRYCHPRAGEKGMVPFHSRLFKEVDSGSAYLDKLERLEQLGILKRERGYRNGYESKQLHFSISLDWDGEPFLVEGKSPESLDDALVVLYPGEELKEILKREGVDARAISSVMRSLAKKRHPIL